MASNGFRRSWDGWRPWVLTMTVTALLVSTPSYAAASGVCALIGSRSNSQGEPYGPSRSAAAGHSGVCGTPASKKNRRRGKTPPRG
ncbi:hypothetical protein ABZY81_07060 [Streptomyces sp. NPDC006514]|uniref:hypothetical protein n=1 Tax=Streptomyces sp. NPDC006514 TaxID=3154308 RepID=UPI0033A1AC8A